MVREDVALLRVDQWLDEWNLVPVDPERFQSAPPKFFYLASMSASHLKSLSGVYPRNASTTTDRAADPFVQRTLDTERTDEIMRYVRTGYPLSGLGGKLLGRKETNSLRKPGWLPTAIVANVLLAGSSRDGRSLAKVDTISIVDADSPTLQYPESWTDSDWSPEDGHIHPLEIIDGQHRLSAFDDENVGDFDLPVVVFVGLDFAWQAYLFWTINIKPKRINPSLAYDLYPLLREQEWLEAGEGLNVYRETRSQELVELLWRTPGSPWFDRINMLGQRGVRGDKPVTQSAFIGSLSTTFVRSFKGQKGLGGLFGGMADGSGLGWPRSQQASLLIYAWSSLASAISSVSWAWAESVRGLTNGDGQEEWLASEPRNDPAIVGEFSLLRSDQGIRAFHMVMNDLLYVAREKIGLPAWKPDTTDLATDDALPVLMEDLDRNGIGSAVRDIAKAMAEFDWRNSQAPGLEPIERELRLALRGSGGYNVLRDRLLLHLREGDYGWVADVAREVSQARGIAD
jgi:DGQHR domain-containing protein